MQLAQQQPSTMRLQQQRGAAGCRAAVARPPLVSSSLGRSRLQPRRSAVVAHADGKLVTKITGEQLEVEIANRDRPLIVDFFATWCGPCVLLAQELEKAAEQLGDKVRILKIDVDENAQLSSMLKIEGLPTIVFIPKEAEKPALRTEGLLPCDQIVQIVNEL